MEVELKAVNKQRDETLDGIQTIKKRLIERVEDLEKRAVEEVKEKHKQIANDINAWSKKVNDMMIDVELRLDKLKQSKAENDVQTFVDIKYGEKQVSDGNDCIKQYLATKLDTLEFSVNRSVETFLRDVQSLGTLTVLAAGKAVGGALVNDFLEQNALPAHIEQYVLPKFARPCSAYGQQTYVKNSKFAFQLGAETSETTHSPAFILDTRTRTSTQSANNASRAKSAVAKSVTSSPSAFSFGSMSQNQPPKSSVCRTPVTTSNSFGAPVISGNIVGAPITAGHIFGAPVTSGIMFGTPASSFGSPSIFGAQVRSFGAPVTTSNILGAPVTTSSIQFGAKAKHNCC